MRPNLIDTARRIIEKKGACTDEQCIYCPCVTSGHCNNTADVGTDQPDEEVVKMCQDFLKSMKQEI